MRYLVTGCTGFIGIHLCRELLKQGHHVVGLVRTPSKLPSDFQDKIKVVRGDLASFQDRSFEMPEVDIIIHLAGVTTGKSQKDYGAVNYDAVAKMMHFFQEKAWQPKRFVFASSLAAAGPSLNDQALTEKDPSNPIDLYGEAKLRAEELMRKQPFPTTSFRPPIVLGPGDPASLALYKMVRTGLAAIPNGPTQKLSFIYVDDLVQAICAIAADTSQEHKLYFTTHENIITNEQLLREVANALGKKVRILRLPHWMLWGAMQWMTFWAKILPFRNQLDRKQYTQMVAPAFLCTSEQLTKDSGWKAKTDLPEILERSVEGYREMGWLK